MLDSLKQAGKNIGHGLGRTWESLAEGWRELLGRGNEALTHFVRSKDEEQKTGTTLSTLPRWSLLAGEVEETDKEILVHIEIPGMEKEDCRITIENNMLYLCGRSALNAKETKAPTISWSVPMALSSVLSPCRAMCSNLRIRPMSFIQQNILRSACNPNECATFTGYSGAAINNYRSRTHLIQQ